MNYYMYRYTNLISPLFHHISQISLLIIRDFLYYFVFPSHHRHCYNTFIFFHFFLLGGGGGGSA